MRAVIQPVDTWSNERGEEIYWFSVHPSTAIPFGTVDAFFFVIDAVKNQCLNTNATF